MKRTIPLVGVFIFGVVLAQAVQASIYVADVNGNLGSVNPIDRSVSSVKAMTLNGVVTKLTDIAVDSSNQMWGVDSDYLYKVNQSSGELTRVGALDPQNPTGPSAQGANALAINPSTGDMYLASANSSYIFSVDTTSGLATAIPVVNPQPATSWYSAGDLAFFGGELYWTANHSPNPTGESSLIKISLPGVQPIGIRGVISLPDGSTLTDVWGLVVDGGKLYAISGGSTDIYRFVDPTVSAVVENLGSYGGHGLSAAYRSSLAVPEPATLAVWGILVAVAIGVCRWQRRKAA